MAVEQSVLLLSDFLGLHERSVWKWRERGLETEDPLAVAKFLRKIQRPAPSVAQRIAEGSLEERLTALLQADDCRPPQFAERCLTEIRRGLLGVALAVRLFANDAELLSRYGTPAAARRSFGVSGERELATLLLAAREIFEIQLDAINNGFDAVMAKREDREV